MNWSAAILFGLLAVTHYLAFDFGAASVENRQLAATVKTVSEARATERSQAETIQREVTHAQTEISAIPDNRDALERLRLDNARLRAELSDTAAAAKRGEAATRAGMVYAELLERAQERIAGLERVAGRAVELAEAYDESRARGVLAVKVYESNGSVKSR